MAWYDIENTNCLFAIDYNSVVDSNLSILSFSNDPTKKLTAYQGNPNCLRKEITSGMEIINFSYSEPSSIKTYKTLRIEKKMLDFEEPLNLPNNFTLIIKCKIITPTVFLSANGQGLNHGPTFEASPLNSGEMYWYQWRLSNFESGQDYTASERLKGSTNTFVTMILKGDMALRTVSMTTNYGSYNITNSSAYSYFLQPQNIEVLGYVYSDLTWLPNANIVAYGLFDRDISDLEVSNMLSEIDNEFLLENKALKIGSKNLKNNFKFNEISSSTFSNFKKIEKFYSYFKPQKREDAFQNYLVISDLFIEDTSIKNYTKIKDIVYEEGIPVSTKLFLLKRSNGHLVAQTTSKANGHFEFNNLNKDIEYIVIASDKKYQFKSILKDYDNRD